MTWPLAQGPVDETIARSGLMQVPVAVMTPIVVTPPPVVQPEPTLPPAPPVISPTWPELQRRIR
jgi:hypothetical protein